MNEPQRTVVYTVSRVGWGTVIGLVALRVVLGWHFYCEGTKKLAYNPTTGKTRVAFSAEGFLRGAVGPFAHFYKRDLPTQHNWEQLLVVPRRAGSTTEEETAATAAWQSDYDKRRAEAAKAGKPLPVEFPPKAPYTEWARQIEKDWRAMVDAFKAIPGLSAEQNAKIEEAYATRRQELADYLAGEANSFADWQHELWRLGDWEAADEAAAGNDAPFETARIVEKRAETTAGSSGWVGQVSAIEETLQRDLRRVLTTEQESNAQTVSAANAALGDGKQRRLEQMNFAITCLIIGVGACLMLGLFTRLAALGGIAFLTMVILSQPPWVAGATTTVFYYQLVEIAALAVIFIAGAGRWAGLDFFLRALFGRRRATNVQTTVERT